jgi:hypothetical protein
MGHVGAGEGEAGCDTEDLNGAVAADPEAPVHSTCEPTAREIATEDPEPSAGGATCGAESISHPNTDASACSGDRHYYRKCLWYQLVSHLWYRPTWSIPFK